MKQTLTAHDVSALVAEYSKHVKSVTKDTETIHDDNAVTFVDDLNTETDDNAVTPVSTDTGGLVGMYLENVYDIDKKTLILKLKYKSVRKYLLIESGQRMHTVERFGASGSGAPKSFCVKIRKHVRERRVVSIKQINHDRVIDIQFGSDESEPYHMILEFYASGNIILTDKNYLILDLVHYHCYDEKKHDDDLVQKDKDSKQDSEEKKRLKKKEDLIVVRPGQSYPFDKACAKESDHDVDTSLVEKWFSDDVQNFPTKKKLKDCVSSSPFKNYPTVIIEHAMANQGFLMKHKVGRGDTLPPFVAKTFVDEIMRLLIIFDTVNQHQETDDINVDVDARRLNIVTSTGYYPYRYSHLGIDDIDDVKRFESFDLAVREWYANTRGEVENRSEIILKKDPKSFKKVKKNGVEKKNDIVLSIQSKMTDLQHKKDHIAEIIQCCEKHSIYIEIVLDHILTMHANGYRIDQENIATMFANQSLKITNIKCNGPEKTITFEDTTDEKSIEIVLDWTISVNKNIRNIYGNSKNLNGKMIKTQSVIKSIEKKIIKERKIEEKSNIVIIRKQLWFEKYNWFLSSDNFLVVSGKDVKSNEYLVKNIMKEHDLYVHSDLPGSGSCIIINPNKLSPDVIGVRTKEEAGLFVVAHTKAWDSNSPNNAFWVTGDQVSKTPESGEFLVPGSFIIRGKRNYMTPVNFVMGFCILFWNGNEITRIRYSDTKFAIISCAPYTASSDCVYKKKIVPGTGKINKAIENITKYFYHDIGTNDSEISDISDKEYIKNIPVDDWHRVCPGKVRVM